MLILALIGLFFIAYCLAVIGEVDDGERTVLGYNVVSLGLGMQEKQSTSALSNG